MFSNGLKVLMNKFLISMIICSSLVNKDQEIFMFEKLATVVCLEQNN